MNIPNRVDPTFSDDDIKRIAARLFDSAVTTLDGLNEPRPDAYELRRVNVGSDLPLAEFKLRLSGLWPARGM